MQGKVIAVSTTTHTLKSPYRVWGKTIDILSCLSEFGGLTPREISEKMLYPCKQIRATCKRLFLRGYVEPVSMGGFRLTPTGISILSFNNNNNRLKIGSTQAQNRLKIGSTCHKQFTLSAWERDRSETERVVVDTLIEHWKKTGSPYIWARDLDPEKLHIPPTELHKAVNDLRRDNILYSYRDRHSKLIKVGLKEAFLLNLQFQ